MSFYQKKSREYVSSFIEGHKCDPQHGLRVFTFVGLDAMPGLWSVNPGYSETALAEAAYDPLRKMPYDSLTQSHLPVNALSEKLKAIPKDRLHAVKDLRFIKKICDVCVVCRNRLNLCQIR